MTRRSAFLVGLGMVIGAALMGAYAAWRMIPEWLSE